MGLVFDSITIDRADPVSLATFWAEAIGFVASDLDPEGNEFCVLREPADGWAPPGAQG